MQSTFDPYQVLDIPAEAGAQAVKAAYRKQALRWHPDRRVDDPRAAEQFHRVHQAYRLLYRPSRSPGPVIRHTAVDYARRDLSWLQAGGFTSTMTHTPRRTRRVRSTLSRAGLEAKYLAARVAPALRLSGWMLVIVWLLLGTIGAARIVEGCYRKLHPAGPNEPLRAGLADQGQWIFAWMLAGAMVILLARRGQWTRRIGGALLVSAAATCLSIQAIDSPVGLVLLPVLAAGQITASCFLTASKATQSA